MPFVLPITFTHFWEKVWTGSRCELRDRFHTGFLYLSSTYRGLGSIDIMAAVRSLLFIGKVKKDPTTRVLIHEKSSLAPPGETLAFKLGDEEGFRWIGAYDINADDLLNGKEGKPTETKLERGTRLMEELLKDGKKSR